MCAGQTSAHILFYSKQSLGSIKTPARSVEKCQLEEKIRYF